jgi:hypothetical protein
VENNDIDKAVDLILCEQEMSGKWLLWAEGLRGRLLCSLSCNVFQVFFQFYVHVFYPSLLYYCKFQKHNLMEQKKLLKMYFLNITRRYENQAYSTWISIECKFLLFVSSWESTKILKWSWQRH